MWGRGIFGLAVLACCAGSGVARAGPAPPSLPRAAVLARVEDGRTVWLDARGSPPFRARLAWVALAETPTGGSKGEPPGAAARRRLEVWAGQAVEFVTVGRDPDGVPLVEILWRPTGESVVTLNYEMVRGGFERADCQTSGDYALQCRVLRRAEEVARQERRGLWAAP